MDFNRDRWGRPLITNNDGKQIPYTRFSSVGQVLEDKFALEKWKLRTAGKGLASRTDLYAQIAACPATDSKRLDELMSAALEAGGSSVGAGLGTALHEFTQNLDLGKITLDDIPDPWRADVAAYQQTIADYGLIVDRDLVEVTLVNDELELAGTADRFFDVGDGTLVCADLKTGKAIGDNPLGYIVQLAAYANSQRYDITTGQRTRVGTVNLRTGLIIHVPAGQARCDIYEVDLITGLDLARLAVNVRQWQKKRGLVSKVSVVSQRGSGTTDQGGVGETTTAMAAPPTPPTPTQASDERRRWIENRVRIIAANPDARKQLRLAWPTGVPTLREFANHTDIEIDGIVTACDLIEGLFGFAFGDPDPKQIRPVSQPRTSVNTRTPEPAVDEGDMVDDENLRVLQAQLRRLNAESAQFMKWLTASCTAAKASVSLKAMPSIRRYYIGRFIANISELADRDVLTAVMATAVDNFDVEHPGRTIGRLTTEQAASLAAITSAVSDGGLTLRYHDNGTPWLDGDLASLQATAA